MGETDLSVRAVISCYGPTDLRAYYDYTRQNIWGNLGQATEAHPPGPLVRGVLGTSYERLGLGKSGAVGAMEPLVGAHREPSLIAMRSSRRLPMCSRALPRPVAPGSKDDVIAPVSATNLPLERLVASGVPAVNIVFPHAEHGFDLVLPRWSPAAQTAWYYQSAFWRSWCDVPILTREVQR